MELDWVMLARDAQLRDDGTIDISGGAVDGLLVSGTAFPVRLGLVLAARISGPMAEWREPGHALDIAVTDAAGKALRHVREPLREVAAPPSLRPHAVPGRLLAIQLRWNVADAGQYLLTIQLDRQARRELTVTVFADPGTA